MQISEMSWINFENESRRVSWGVIPTGAVEAYGPHLPLGTDGLVAQYLAKLLGERLPAFVGPLIPVGYSSSFTEFPGTLSVSPHVLEQYVFEISKSFLRHGIKKLVFITGHAGNVQPIGYVMEQLQDCYGAFCIQLDIWRFLQSVSTGIVSNVEQAVGHASELMTSIMLYLYPHLVDMSKVPQDVPTLMTRRPGVITVQKLDPQSSIAVYGNPLEATAEKGKLLVEKAVEEMLVLLRTL